MENSEALKRIYKDIAGITEKLNTLKNTDASIPEDALQLVSVQLSLAARTLDVLENLTKTEEKHTAAVAEETIPVDLKQVVGMSLENAPEPVKQQVEQPIVKQEVRVVKQEEPAPVIKEEPAPVAKKEEPTPPAPAKKTGSPHNDEKPDTTFAGRMKSKPISDLKAAIGINEKFAFIKLFGSDATAWNEALQKLNSSASYIEAEELLSRYTEKYHWKEEDEALQALAGLVQRRFL